MDAARPQEGPFIQIDNSHRVKLHASEIWRYMIMKKTTFQQRLSNMAHAYGKLIMMAERF